MVEDLPCDIACCVSLVKAGIPEGGEPAIALEVAMERIASQFHASWWLRRSAELPRVARTPSPSPLVAAARRLVASLRLPLGSGAHPAALPCC